MARPHSRRSSRGIYEEVILAPPGSPTSLLVEHAVRTVIPTPPTRPPEKKVSLGSTKRRLRSSASLDNQEDGVDPFARRPSRPNSSLSKYKPLPEISPQNTTNIQERINSSKIDKMSLNLDKLKLDHKKSDKDRLKSEINGDHISSNTSNFKEGSKSKTPQTLPQNTIKKKSKELEKTIVLGIKLPKTGDRVTCPFRVTDTLSVILKFVEEQCGERLSHLYHLAINMPRKIFIDSKITIKQAGLEDKTILYLVEKDEV